MEDQSVVEEEDVKRLEPEVTPSIKLPVVRTVLSEDCIACDVCDCFIQAPSPSDLNVSRCGYPSNEHRHRATDTLPSPCATSTSPSADTSVSLSVTRTAPESELVLSELVTLDQSTLQLRFSHEAISFFEGPVSGTGSMAPSAPRIPEVGEEQVSHSSDAGLVSPQSGIPFSESHKGCSQLHGYENLMYDQVCVGQESVKVFSKFFRDLATIEQEYASKVQARIQEEFKTKNIALQDQMPSIKTAWFSILSSSHDYAKAHSKLANCLLTQVCEDLDSFSASFNTLFKSVTLEAQVFNAAILTLNEEIARRRSVCRKKMSKVLSKDVVRRRDSKMFSFSAKSLKKSHRELLEEFDQYEELINETNHFLRS